MNMGRSFERMSEIRLEKHGQRISHSARIRMEEYYAPGLLRRNRVTLHGAKSIFTIHP